MSARPTKAQADLLRYAVQQGGAVGMLGTPPRTVEACLARGWIVEERLDRGFGLGPGVRARITDVGRAALEASDRP